MLYFFELSNIVGGTGFFDKMEFSSQWSNNTCAVIQSITLKTEPCFIFSYFARTTTGVWCEWVCVCGAPFMSHPKMFMPQGYMSHKKTKGSEKPKVSSSREKPKACLDTRIFYCVREWESAWVGVGKHKKKTPKTLKTEPCFFSYLPRTFATLNLSKKGNNGHVHYSSNTSYLKKKVGGQQSRISLRKCWVV